MWHLLPISEVVATLQTDGERGLIQAEVTRRLAQYGPNSLPQAQAPSALGIFLAQFRSLIVALLVAATLIAFAMGETLEAVAILVVIILNASIGFFTERKAEKALSALQQQSVRVAHVIRDGVECEIPASELVPGDVIVLAAGARVPADGRIIESARLQIEEAALTGESLAVTKSSEQLKEKDASLGDRLNMAFLGTTITDGRGRLVVTATGAQTEMGKIGTLSDEATTRATSLEQKLALRIGALCNDAKVERHDGHDTVLGDPTEAALIVVAEKAGMDLAQLCEEFVRVDELPFDSIRQRMVTVHRTTHGRTIAFVKGSPGKMLAASTTQFRAKAVTPLTPDERKVWEQANLDLAGAALRVLGLGYRDLPEDYSEDDLTRDLTFVGLVGMSDPLRDEAKSAIATCREAGIRTVMITGDQQATAAEIARQLGIDRDLDQHPLRIVH